MKNKKFVISLLVVIIFFCGYLFVARNNSKLVLCTQSNTVVSSITNNDSLKIEYFDDAIGVWGSGLPKGETQWKGVDSKYAQRSAPSAITHPLNLITESIKLLPVKRDKIKYDSEFYSGEQEEEYYKSYIDDMYAKYDESFGGYFASKGEVITTSKYHDVDRDGFKEQIVETVTIGGNHPPHFGYIIKNGVVILSMLLNSGGIDSTKDGNGFYVQDKMYGDNGLCCPVGYRLYRVIYEDNSFRPVWEQEVKYISFDNM